MVRRKRPHLTVEDFGPIAKVDVPLADLTVLVGPQATGKSLVLQWLKLAVDKNRVLGTLSQHGFDVHGDPQRLAGWFFGAGYQKSVRPETRVSLGGQVLDIEKLARGKRITGAPKVMYVPAHRALVMGTSGWPQTFRTFVEDTPFVVRDFSERLRELLSQRELGDVFPAEGRLRKEVRVVLDEALFHRGRIVVESRGLGGKELRLVHGEETKLSQMEWTTGQREMLPLIAGLYEALPSGKTERRKPIEWVVVEEPELGLHPDGILSVMLLLFECLRRGYKVLLSTHSSLVLDVLWAIQQLRGAKDGTGRLADILGIRKTRYAKEELAHSALTAGQSVVALSFADGKVRSHDITTLDPFSDEREVAGWGGLMRHNTRISELVAGS